MRRAESLPVRDKPPPAPKQQAKATSRRPRRAPPAPPPKPTRGIRTFGAITLLVLLVLALGRGALPFWCAAVCLLASALSFLLYRQDKMAAEAGEWRVSEGALHAIDLGGGIIGGLLAQQRFRHKTRKASFVLATAGITLLHVLGLAALVLGILP